MKCKECGRRNLAGTLNCQYCQGELEQEESKSKLYILLALLCLIVLCVLIALLHGQVNQKDGVIPVDKASAFYWNSITLPL